MLEEWIDDIRSMDIVTATSKDLRVQIDPTNADLLKGLPAEVQIKVRTTIQLDGDLIVLFPTKEGTENTTQIDNHILQIHKENVDFALKNLTNNMKIITDGIVRALSLAKEYGLPGISNKLEKYNKCLIYSQFFMKLEKVFELLKKKDLPTQIKFSDSILKMYY